MIDLRAFQQLILLVIAIHERHGEGSPHGLGIKADITEMYRVAGDLEPGEKVNHGRLYPNLDELVDLGLLSKSARDKRTNEYSLTEAGTDAIDQYADLVALACGDDGSNPFAPPSSDINPVTAEAD